MNIQPMSQQPISDDQELAKVLAGVGNQTDDPSTINENMGTTPALSVMPPVAPADSTQATADTAVTTVDTAAETPELPPMPEMPSVVPPMPPSSTSMGDTELDSIKQTALNELRPLVDKLDVAPEEKFDTYLLLLRSTDDKSLIAPAHEAAKNITDEARRAQALLDIIKEIDFLNQPAA